MATPTDNTQDDLARRGAGGEEDQLRFRLVIKILWRSISLLKAVKWHLVLIVALGIAGALLLLPAMQLYDLFLTRALKGELPSADQCRKLAIIARGCEPWDEEARRAALRGLSVVTAGVALYAGLAFAALYYYRLWILQRINHVLRMLLHERLNALSLRFHNETAVGDGIYRMYQDSSVITQLIDQAILMPIWHLGWVLFTTGVIALYDKQLALAPIVGWIIALVVGYRFSRPLRTSYRRSREATSALTAMIQASLQGARLLKAYGAERAEQARFEALSQTAFEHNYVARSRLIVFSLLSYFGFAIAAICAVAVGAYLASKGVRFPAKAAVAYMGFTAWNLGVWSNIRGRAGNGVASSTFAVELWGRLQDTAIGLDRVFELLDLEPEVKDAPDAIAMPRFERAIEFDDVSFAYDASRPTLQQVKLHAPASSITAIVGPTGSGKSTLMALLLRLYEPDRGAIRIDGTDIRKLKLDSLRSNVSIALQENMLFGTTIRENIRYAVPDASDAAVREAARVAAADEFIDKLELGYDTLLGERGAKLSSGQRQRLSIARAILKNSPILILDEPTAALDAETELRVLDNLAAWGKGRAVFLITHRLSTIRRADQVVFVQDGHVIERGSHESLMAKAGGAYRRLVEGEEAAARAQPQTATP